MKKLYKYNVYREGDYKKCGVPSKQFIVATDAENLKGAIEDAQETWIYDKYGESGAMTNSETSEEKHFLNGDFTAVLSSEDIEEEFGRVDEYQEKLDNIYKAVVKDITGVVNKCDNEVFLDKPVFYKYTLYTEDDQFSDTIDRVFLKDGVLKFHIDSPSSSYETILTDKEIGINRLLLVLKTLEKEQLVTGVNNK